MTANSRSFLALIFSCLCITKPLVIILELRGGIFTMQSKFPEYGFWIFKVPIWSKGRLFHTLFNSRFYLCNFSSTFFYEQKKTHERSVPAVLLSFAKGFSKHPHIFTIFKVVSGYLRLPFKLNVDYFILNLILVSTSVIFLLLFSMNKQRRRNEASLL